MATPVNPEGSRPICPECGRDPRADPPRPLLLRRPWLVPLILLSILVAVVCWKNATLDWKPLPPMWHDPQIVSLDFPPERITTADLEAMSTGRGPADALLKFMAERMDHTSSNTHVAFVPPIGDRLDMVRYGWPFQLLLQRTQAEYEDVFAREGVTRAYPSRSTGWRGWRSRSWVWNAPGPGGVVRIHLLTLDSIAAMFVVIAAVWFVARLVRDLACAVRFARRGGQRVRDRAVRHLPALVTLFAAAMIVMLSITSPTRESTAYPIPITAPTSRVIMSGADLAAMPEHEQGPALARAILDAQPPRTPPDADCLAVSTELLRPRVVGYGGGTWPEGLMNYTVARDAGANEPPVRRTMSFDSWGLAIGRSAGGGVLSEQYAVVVPVFVMYLGAPIAIGLPWVATVRAVEWRRRRRSRRRTAAGLCVHCAYEVGS